MPEGIPTHIVLKLRSQGLSNNQIINNLQREGYNIRQISDAMAQANVKHTVEGIPIEGEKMPEEIPTGYPESYPGYPAVEGEPAAHSVAGLQPLIERVVEEKWTELMKDLEKLAGWKDKTDERLAKIEQQLTLLKESFDKLHEGVLGQIAGYDKSVKDVGTSVKAMEDVFKKILPGFVENVQELSRITKDIKKGKK